MNARLYYFLWNRVNREHPGYGIWWRLWAALSFVGAGEKHLKRGNKRMAMSQWRTALRMLIVGCTCLVLASCGTTSRPNPAADAIATLMLQPVD